MRRLETILILIVVAGALCAASYRELMVFKAGLTVSSGNVTISDSYLLQEVAAGVTAAGTTVADATQLAATINAVTTVAASTGVKLPAAAVGATVVVQNLGANNLEVYPPDASGVLNAASAGEGITLAAATDDILTCYKTATNKWICSLGAGPAT